MREACSDAPGSAVGGAGACSRSIPVERGQYKAPKSGCGGERAPREETRRADLGGRQMKDWV